MTGALFRKELRELRPWALLAVVFWSVDVLDELMRATDLRPLEVTFADLSGSMVPIVWVLAFAIGTSLGVREGDDGTLAFLDGLPVTRTRVFLVKLAVAAGVLLSWPLLRTALAVVLHLVSRGSLDHDVRPLLLAQVLALDALLVVSGLSFGAALGRLRSLTWLVASAAGVGLTVLIEHVPRAALLDPLTLADVQLVGTRLHVDGEAVLVQSALAALWGVVAWASFVGTGRPRFAGLSNRPVVGALVAVLTVAAVGGVLVLRSRSNDDADDDDAPKSTAASAEPRFADSAPAATHTTHYRFSYPALQSREALALAGEADAVFEEVHRLLGVPLGPVIDVDASGSVRSTVGTAFLGGVRLKLGPKARAVLAHETAHVVSRRAAGDAHAWLWERAPVLNEGLASWVERRFDGRADERREDWLLLGALHRRHELLVDELVDARALARSRDDRLKYVAGEAVFDATVRLYGTEALPRLLAAFGDETLPPDLDGLRLWQACFQLAGMDLGRVFDELFREVEAQARALEDEVAALPRPRAVVVSYGGRFGARPVVDAPLPKGWHLLLRFRPGPDSDHTSYHTYRVEPGQVVWRGSSEIRKKQLCVQPGVELPAGDVLYEPWGCQPLSEAVPWTPPKDEETAGEGD